MRSISLQLLQFNSISILLKLTDKKYFTCAFIFHDGSNDGCSDTPVALVFLEFQRNRCNYVLTQKGTASLPSCR